MTLSKNPLTLLIVEDNDGDFFLFESYLHLTNLAVRKLYHAKALSEIDLAVTDIDLVFLDLSLPDSGGIESFIYLNQNLPNVPIVILSGLADERTALECIAQGAQDYLLKDELNERFLEKSINYSIERKRNLEEVMSINRQYELIGDITNDVIWKWDIEAQTLVYGKKSFLGYGSEDILNTLEWWLDKIHSEDLEQVKHSICDVLEKNAANLQVEFRFRTAAGHYEYLYSRGALLAAQNDDSRQMVGAIMNITERKKLQDELLKTQVNFQRQVTEAVLLGQEKQKEEIGRELHDNINQILASVKLFIETAISNPQIKEDLLVMSKENIVHAIDEIRKLSHSLVPPSLGDNGLIGALEELIAELEAIGLFTVSLAVDNFDEAALDDTKKLMLYRIVQEQTSNIIKYAGAGEVGVSVKMADKTLCLSVSDNGVGFDTTKKAKGIGLKNIASRVTYYCGEVQLSSSPGKGTRLEVAIPL